MDPHNSNIITDTLHQAGHVLSSYCGYVQVIKVKARHLCDVPLGGEGGGALQQGQGGMVQVPPHNLGSLAGQYIRGQVARVHWKNISRCN